MAKKRLTRRELIKKAAYVAPLILTFAVLPSFASAGSGENGPQENRSGQWRKHYGWHGWWIFRHRVHKWRFHPDKNP